MSLETILPLGVRLILPILQFNSFKLSVLLPGSLLRRKLEPAFGWSKFLLSSEKSCFSPKMRCGRDKFIQSLLLSIGFNVRKENKSLKIMRHFVLPLVIKRD